MGNVKCENMFKYFQNNVTIASNHHICQQFKVSEYPFKQNKNMVKNKTVLLYTYFYIFFHVLRPTYINIYIIYPFYALEISVKMGVKIEPKTSYSSSFMSSCTNRVAVFKNFVSLIFSQPRYKQNRARDFLFFKYFMNNIYF